MIGFLIDYIPEMMPTHFDYCKPLVFNEPESEPEPEPEPKKLPNLPMEIINKIMMFQPRPQYINDIKSLFQTYNKNLYSGDPDRVISIDHYFKNYLDNNIRHRLVKQMRIHHIRYTKIFEDGLTPFSVSFCEYYHDEYGFTMEEWYGSSPHKHPYSWISIIGKNIKVKKHPNSMSKRVDIRYIDTKDLKKWTQENGIELKKSWSRKRLVQELMKL